MWIWDQTAGRMFHDTQSIGFGYAGSPAGRNNPELQTVQGVGPLPVGLYAIGEPHDSPHTGKYTMNLEPAATNEMYGRGDFRIHGDSIKDPGNASHGCIVLARSIRTEIWESGDHQLTVVRQHCEVA